MLGNIKHKHLFRAQMGYITREFMNKTWNDAFDLDCLNGLCLAPAFV